MFRFILAILLLVTALVAVIVRHQAKKEALTDRSYADTAGIAGFVATSGLVLGVVFLGWSCLRVVPANNIGIPKSFGSIGAPMEAGIHFTAPWVEITNLEATVQELSMLRAPDEGDKAKDDSVEVIAKGGGSMKVDVTVRYIIEKPRASDLYRQAGSMDLIKERFVRVDTRSAVRDVFALYTAEEGYGGRRGEIAAKIDDQLRPKLASRGIVLDSVNVRDVSPEKRVLADINAILSARNKAVEAQEKQKQSVTEAETKREVAEKTAEQAKIEAQGRANALDISSKAEAEANRRVAESLTPELAQLKAALACADAIKGSRAVVVNVCGAGSATAAAGSPVIVNGR